MQICVDVTCMYTNFGGRGLYSFGDIATFKNGQISPFRPMDYSPWSSKNLVRSELSSKNSCMYGIDVSYMYTNFGGRGLYSFGDITTFKNGQISLSNTWTIVHGHQKN